MISYAALCNKYMYTTFAYVRLYVFALNLYRTVMHVDSKPVDTSDTATPSIGHREIRKARLYLIAGMLLSLMLGAALMWLWFIAGLVHVTVQEYAIIIVPMQLTIGVVLASIYQAWFEEPREIPTENEPPLSEKGSDEKLTLEGARRAVCFLAHEETDTEVLAKMAATLRRQGDKEDSGTQSEHLSSKDVGTKPEHLNSEEKKNDSDLLLDEKRTPHLD